MESCLNLGPLGGKQRSIVVLTIEWEVVRIMDP